MPLPVYLDLETRSVLSVKDVGVDAMVAAPGMILSAHFAIGDSDVRPWRGAFADGASPMAFDPDPRDLLDAIDAGADVWAHNARFDRTVWNAWAPAHWPRLTVEQTLDSATLCRLANLPAALGQVVPLLGGAKLDNRSYRVLWSAGSPMGPDRAALYAEMLEYGNQDVVAMRDHVIKLLPALDDRTREEWLASERVNDRGFAIDTAWAAWAAEAFARCAQTEGAEISALTSGLVPTPKSTAAALVWAEMHLGRSITRAAKQRVGGGRAGFRTVTKASLDKAARRELRAWLLESDDAPPVTGPAVLEFIDRLDLASDTAGTKYAAAGKRASPDGRLRGSYIFHGASQTGRYSAGGLQPHNLIRHKAKNVAAERAAVAEVPTMKGIGKMLRSTILAHGPGKRLAWRDWSAIEARITPWLALGPDTPPAERESAEAVLNVFHTGGDIYLQAASGIYKREVTKADAEQRQVGKVCLAGDTRVLTRAAGVATTKAMRDMRSCDEVWDGVEWVRHDGVVCNGDSECVSLSGMRLTPDHLVWCGTSAGWARAEEVVLRPDMHRRALASAEECSPSQGISPALRGASAPLSYNATASAPNTAWHRTRGGTAALPGAMLVPKSTRRTQGRRNSSTMPPRARMWSTAGDCSTAYPRFAIDATIQTTALTQGTARAGCGAGGTMNTAKLLWGARRAGGEGSARSNGSSKCSGTSSHCRDGMSQPLSWTGSTTTRATRQATCASYPTRRTQVTNATSTDCRFAFENSKQKLPVYDLVNAGPRARFTVITADGPLIVHNCVLSLGFAGGVGALVAMSRGYNVVVPEPKAIVAAYREANPWIVWFCRAVERAAGRAVRSPGETFTAGKLALVSTGAELLMVLPDGHPLVYPRPRIEMVDRFGSGEEDPTVTFDHPAFGRAALSGPVCSENPTQAVAARLLRRALVFHDREVAADPRVGPIVMHTHDEMVAECETENLGLTASALERSMSTLEPWADGLPIASEGGSGTYYQTEQED